MQPLSKEQILRGFNRGEDRARGSVHDLYHDSLLVMVRKITRDAYNAEDLVSEAFIVLLKFDRSFDQITDLRNFLFNTARNLCKKDFRKQEKSQKKHEELHEVFPYEDEDLDNVIIYSETRSLLYKSIEKLPESLKTVFRLRYFEDMSNEAVAKLLNIAAKTVYNRYYEARQKLKWDLEQAKRFTLYLLNFFL